MFRSNQSNHWDVRTVVNPPALPRHVHTISDLVSAPLGHFATSAFNQMLAMGGKGIPKVVGIKKVQEIGS